MDQPFADKQSVAAFYSELLEKHGDDAKAVGWENPHTQVASFFQLLATEGFESGVSVLDLGCGLGHFKTFLDAQGIEVEYTGWDICEPLIVEARKLHPKARFDARDILAEPHISQVGEQFDFVMASGALTSRLPNHEEWLTAMLREMFRLCRRGMAFNLLSWYYAHDNPLEVVHERYYHAQPERIMGFCLELSRQVVVDHSDLAQSFAVYVYKSNTTAIERLTEHLSPGRRFGPGHKPIVDYYESHGMYHELIGYLQSLEPTAEGYDYLGRLAFLLEDQAHMIEWFEKAVALAPDEVEPRMSLARAYFELEKNQDALVHLERARELEPKNIDINYHLARCLEALGQSEQALEAYRKVSTIDPNHKGARAALERLGK